MPYLISRGGVRRTKSVSASSDSANIVRPQFELTMEVVWATCVSIKIRYSILSGFRPLNMSVTSHIRIYAYLHELRRV